MSDDPTRQPREWPDVVDCNGDKMTALYGQKCGIQMGLRSPGRFDTSMVDSYCFDCAPLWLAEAAMKARGEGPVPGGET